MFCRISVNNRRFRMKLLIMVFIFSINLDVMAGQEGNGGGVQFCANPIQEQNQYETYDLREIKNHIIESRKRIVEEYDGYSTKEEYFARAVAKVKSQDYKLAGAIERANILYNYNVKDMGNYKLEIVSDLDIFSIDKNCEYRQVVNWLDPDDMFVMFGVKELHVLRDNNIYNNMDPLNQAALDFHESIYKVQRAFGLPGGSNFVRMITGQAFCSDKNIDEDLLTKVGTYHIKYQDGYKLFTTSNVCKQKPIIKVFNIGKCTVREIYKDENGVNRTRFKIKPNEFKIFYEDSISLRLFWLKNFKGFFKGEKGPLNLRVDINACGETFTNSYRDHHHHAYSSETPPLKIRIKVMSSPI